jgi:alanine dehydrogenase
MKIAIAKETKPGERRVAFLPSEIAPLVADGNVVLVARGAGEGLRIDDDAYRAVGAVIEDQTNVFGTAELVVKVKEPQPEEFDLLRRETALFAYLHLAADRELTQALVRRNCLAIAFETVTDGMGRLPLLEPMSQVAGRLAVMQGAIDLMASTGILLAGITGNPRTKVVVIGAGTAGLAATATAVGMGAKVILLDVVRQRLSMAESMFGGGFETRLATRPLLEQSLSGAHLVIGAALMAGSKAPVILTRGMLGLLYPGAVAVDLAIDQGGCFEMSRVTTHEDPVFIVDGVLLRCVANVPAAAPLSASQALSTALLPYVSELARKGVRAAIRDNPGLGHGVNTLDGHLTNAGVADAHRLPFTPLPSLVSGTDPTVA